MENLILKIMNSEIPKINKLYAMYHSNDIASPQLVPPWTLVKLFLYSVYPHVHYLLASHSVAISVIGLIAMISQCLRLNNYIIVQCTSTGTLMSWIYPR